MTTILDPSNDRDAVDLWEKVAAIPVCWVFKGAVAGNLKATFSASNILEIAEERLQSIKQDDPRKDDNIVHAGIYIKRLESHQRDTAGLMGCISSLQALLELDPKAKLELNPSQDYVDQIPAIVDVILRSTPQQHPEKQLGRLNRILSLFS